MCRSQIWPASCSSSLVYVTSPSSTFIMIPTQTGFTTHNQVLESVLESPDLAGPGGIYLLELKNILNYLPCIISEVTCESSTHRHYHLELNFELSRVGIPRSCFFNKTISLNDLLSYSIINKPLSRLLSRKKSYL